MAISLHRGDLPADLSFGPVVAIDTETMGLNPHRDRLCLVQLSGGDGNAHLVQIPRGAPKGAAKAPRLAALIAWARFDDAFFQGASCSGNLDKLERIRRHKQKLARSPRCVGTAPCPLYHARNRLGRANLYHALDLLKVHA